MAWEGPRFSRVRPLSALHRNLVHTLGSQMEYCGTTSFFIRTLLDKKYALPYRVIDALVGTAVARCTCCHAGGLARV